MDLFSFGFVLLILAAGGLIAYLADKLGKKIGKKKLSVRYGRWSLRPRHVAEIGTVVMGVLVSLLTILFVAAASSDARAWLREGAHLLVQRDELLRDNEELKKGNTKLLQDSERLAKTKRELEEKTSLLLTRNRELVDTLEAQRGNLAKVQKQKEILTKEAERLGGQVARLQGSLQATSVALEKSKGLLAKNRIALEKASAELKVYQAKTVATQKTLSVANQNVVFANTNLDAARKESFRLYKENLRLFEESLRLQTEIKDLNVDMADLKARQEQAQKDLIAAQNQYTVTQARLVAASKELTENQDFLAQQQQFLSVNIRASRIEPMTFNAREEVTRFPVPGGTSPNLARIALTSLLRSARVEAMNRGAKSRRNKDQFYDVADVFDRQDPISRTAVTADSLKSAVIAAASGRVEDQVLVATSSYNAFMGEPVSLDISVLPNPVIYHKGEMLSEARIDGAEPEDRIFAQLSEFLKTRVQERAKDDGMIPRAGTEAKFGVVPVLDVLNLVRDVKKVGRAVRVQAFAGDDIRAAEPLRLEFRLR